ncbi:cytochrome o ubiquinol oxidase subunit IV [Stenotrophomonas sp. MMGLT7]|uniref:cytochrome o ubiquinol oxidase subunit IV n=1 Tax=Stenotrophomonas sp. MMGLT7 TaxID=2901227 RepID=UPI001E441CAA|nr:cytochrome o ubiquinol oxidase subunit IV [Stenotrophomonas sp. MMGLT7]MCD7100124.1 cytochrome o ubiquinol oxidase subunit IV [Stenotrophomonas sp. MMGLT7]
MAAHDNHQTPAHAAGGEGHGSVKSYLIGFVLAVVLTVIPFAIVMSGGFSRTVAIAAISILGVLQILVHLKFFLHMDNSSEQRWNVSAFAFTVLVIAIIVAGSLWILYNMNRHMM